MKILIGLIIASVLTYTIVNFNKAEKDSGLKTNTDYNKVYKNTNSKLISEKLSSMTLREKIAQMVIADAVPENLSENSAEFRKLRKLAEETKVGGFIFFKGSSSDYVKLANKLQGFSETPLLISADFERGTKMRVTDGALFPTNMAIGAADNFELTYKMGLEVARETRLLGIHQNYSPVCDVNNNPNNSIINVRSFGEDPQIVSRMSEAMIKGLQEGKVIATAKHFPGHGDTDIDSHNDLPQLNFTMDRMNTIELVPFKNAISKNVMSVMIAHLAFPELEKSPNIPASLSPQIVQELLINKMEFKGLVVTDALNMKGITKYFSTSEVAVMCVNAGIDLILMPLDAAATVNAIENAVNSGSISEERINRSAEKILKAKEWLGLFENRLVNESGIETSVNTPEANSLAQQIADASITLVKDDKNILPFKNISQGNTAFVLISEGGEQDNTGELKMLAPDHFKDCAFYTATSSVMDNELKGSLNSLGAYENIIVAIYAKVRYGTGKISISSQNIDLVNRLNETGKNMTVISLGNPYLLKEFPSVPSYICAYGDSDFAIKAVLKAISGSIKFKGKLPVTITDNYKFGSSILK